MKINKNVSNNPLKTIEDFFESFPEYKLDMVESDLCNFSHEFPIEDFDEYIIVDDKIKIEKGICVNE